MLINHDQLGVTAIYTMYQHASEVAVDFAIAFWRNFSGPAVLSVVQIEATSLRQSSVGSFVFSKVQIASHGNQGKQITP